MHGSAVHRRYLVMRVLDRAVHCVPRVRVAHNGRLKSSASSVASVTSWRNFVRV